MIKNRWASTRFYCMNHKETGAPVEMLPYTESNTPFYACPKYFLKDEKHPDGHEEGDKQCLNRLSTTAAANIIERVSMMVEQAHDSGEFLDFRNCRFLYTDHGTKYDVTILELNERSEKVRIGVKSQKESAGWKQY